MILMNQNFSKNETEEDLISSLLAQKIPQSKSSSHFLHWTLQTRHDRSWEREHTKKYRWNYCHLLPMLSLLGANHRLPLFHMGKRFIWINETKKSIDEFTIGYIISLGLNVNKYFKEQMEKCIYTTFGPITQPFIKTTLSKKNTLVLALILVYETRGYNPKK